MTAIATDEVSLPIAVVMTEEYANTSPQMELDDHLKGDCKIGKWMPKIHKFAHFAGEERAMECALWGHIVILYPRVTLYTAGHLHTAVPYCSHSRAPIVHTAVPRENNEHGCVYLRCRAVCKLPGCVEGHPWYRTLS